MLQSQDLSVELVRVLLLVPLISKMYNYDSLSTVSYKVHHRHLYFRATFLFKNGNVSKVSKKGVSNSPN
jgi:hypothetical protein